MKPTRRFFKRCIFFVFTIQHVRFMRYSKWLFVALIIPIFFSSGLQAQRSNLEEVELKLQKMAIDLLTHDSLNYKISTNKQFARLLIQTLKQPASFNYPFDSLKSISILKPEDNSFRIFTWHIVDKKL